MVLCCPFGITRFVPQEKSVLFPYNKAFIEQKRWLNIGFVLFFCVIIDIASVSVHKHAKKTKPISRHVDVTLGEQGWGRWGAGGEQGWRSGESARLPPMCPGFDSQTRRHMWVEFVVGSIPCFERFFSGYAGFLLSSKTNIFKFQFDLDYGQALYHKLLARVIAQVLPVFDIKFNFTFLLLKLAPFHIAVHIYPGRLKTLLLQLRLASNPLKIYGLAYSSFVFLFILYSDKTPHTRTILRYIRN